MRQGKEVADYLVENALYRRAVGFTYKETRTEKNSEGEITRTVTTKKTALPDARACEIWLRNRRPDVWRDRPEDLDIEDSDAYFAAAELDSEEDPEGNGGTA